MAFALRKQLKQMQGIVLLDEEQMGAVIEGFDPLRIVLSLKGTALSGFEAAEILAQEYRIYVEMADTNNIILVIGFGTQESLSLIHI